MFAIGKIWLKMDLATSFKALQTTSQIWGYCSTGLDREKQSTTAVQRRVKFVLNCVLTVANILALVIFTYFMVEVGDEFYSTLLANKVYKILTMFNGLAAVMSIGIFFVNREKQSKILDKLKQCDKLLLEINLQMDYKKQGKTVQRALWSHAAVILILSVYMAYISIFVFPMSVVIFLSFYMFYTQMSSTLTFGHMAISLLAILIRVRALNLGLYLHCLYDKAHPFTKRNSQIIITQTSSLEKSGVLRNLAVIDQILKDLIVLANQCFSFQVNFNGMLLKFMC